MDPSLIKANENPVAFQRATSPPIPDTFPLEIPTQESTLIPTTSTLVAPEQPLIIDTKAMPSIATPAPEPSDAQVTSADYLIMSAIAFQGSVHRLTRTEAQLGRLIDQLNPKVCQIVWESEERAKAFTIVEVDRRVIATDGRIKSFKDKVQ